MSLLYTFSAGSFLADQNAQLVVGDLACRMLSDQDSRYMEFDDTNDMAAVLLRYRARSITGSLRAILQFSHNGTTGVVGFEAFVESLTPGSDTTVLPAASNWDTANAASKTVRGVTDTLDSLSITLTNRSSWAENDMFRIGIRRDTSVASNASGFTRVYTVSLEDDAT